jgi:hypothetical protein
MKKLFLALALAVTFAMPAMAGEVPNPPPGAFANSSGPYQHQSPVTEDGIPSQYRLGG